MSEDARPADSGLDIIAGEADSMGYWSQVNCRF